MIVKRAGLLTVVWTPAKLNLFLEVLHRRGDGYHEIETLMSPIAWRDTLYFVPDQSGRVTLDCQWTLGIEARRNCRRASASGKPYAHLPPADDNLVMRAVKLLQAEAGVASGARIQLRKRIPAAAGLGGASSDAAAALVAANLGWKLEWPLERLCKLAARLGSDIPFFLLSKPAICRGRGERIESIDCRGVQHNVIVKPATGLSTAAVYRQCRVPAEPKQIEPLQAALTQGAGRASRYFFNRLAEPAAMLSPELANLKGELERIGQCSVFMSGSGTSHFVPCRNARHARRVAARARGRGLGAVCCSAS